MDIVKYTQILAEYNCGSYSAGSYQGTCSSQSGSLANTGFDVLIPLCLGAALIIASAILFVRRFVRRRQQQRAQSWSS